MAANLHSRGSSDDSLCSDWGTLRGVPDSASVSLDAVVRKSGVPARPSNRISGACSSSITRRAKALRSGDDRAQPSRNRKIPIQPQLSAVPQPVTPAVEAPRLILPFTTSITLRQDATSSPTIPPLQTQPLHRTTRLLELTAAADPNAVACSNRNNLSYPCDSPEHAGSATACTRVSDYQSECAQPKQRNRRLNCKDSVPSKTEAAAAGAVRRTAPADPSIPTSGHLLDHFGTSRNSRAE